MSCPIVAQHGLGQMLWTGVGGAKEQAAALGCGAGLLQGSTLVFKGQQTDANASRTAMPRLACGTQQVQTALQQTPESGSSAFMLPFFHCADSIPHHSVTACHSNYGLNVRYLGFQLDSG